MVQELIFYSQRTTAETLVILLHTTFVPRLIDSSSRPRPLTRSTHGSPHDGPSSSASSSFPNDHPGTSRQIDRKGKGRATADDPTTGSERPDPSARSRTGADGDADVALLAALNLATASNNIREKRIGYLYLAECMEVGHELGLMFINTIRKVSCVLGFYHMPFLTGQGSEAERRGGGGADERKVRR